MGFLPLVATVRKDYLRPSIATSDASDTAMPSCSSSAAAFLPSWHSPNLAYDSWDWG